MIDPASPLATACNHHSPRGFKILWQSTDGESSREAIEQACNVRYRTMFAATPDDLEAVAGHYDESLTYHPTGWMVFEPSFW